MMINLVKHLPNVERANNKTSDGCCTVQKCLFLPITWRPDPDAGHPDQGSSVSGRDKSMRIHVDCGSGTLLASCLSFEHNSANLNTLYCLLETVDHSLTTAPDSLEK
jgi:hypothetical protein